MCRYRGQWVQGAQEGRGQCQYADGSSYSGDWRAGVWHGLGEWRERGPPAPLEEEAVGAPAATAAAAVQGGETVAAAKDAGTVLGALRSGGVPGAEGGPADGAWYRGDFVEGRREGQGAPLGCTTSLVALCVYLAPFIHERQRLVIPAKSRFCVHTGRTIGTPARTGVARLSNGDRYRGTWLAGRRHGRGELVAAAGDRYVGEWAAGERHGQGSCLFANGDKYTGENGGGRFEVRTSHRGRVGHAASAVVVNDTGACA